MITVNKFSAYNCPPIEPATTVRKHTESKVSSDYLQPISTCKSDANSSTECINNKSDQFIDSICCEVAQNNGSTYLEVINSDDAAYDEISHNLEVSVSGSIEINQSISAEHWTSVSIQPSIENLITNITRLSRHRLETIVENYLRSNVGYVHCDYH